MNADLGYNATVVNEKELHKASILAKVSRIAEELGVEDHSLVASDVPKQLSPDSHWLALLDLRLGNIIEQSH